MANPIVGKVEFQTEEATPKTVMTFDPSFGGKNGIGSLIMLGSNGKHRMRFLADSGSCLLGGNGSYSTLTLDDSNSKLRIGLYSEIAACHLGGNGAAGQISLFSADAEAPNFGVNATIQLHAGDASVRVGGRGQDGDLTLKKANNATTIQLDAKSGDIKFFNADCAEEFEVDDTAIEAGSVLVFGSEPGRLRLSDVAYDTRVAGILSGAGEYRPAIVLDRQPELEGRRPVALVGKAWCKVEAESAPIGVGTLLTTSSLPGHAMAATDRDRAFGAVLGKALSPLAAGLGIVPVLVSLQ